LPQGPKMADLLSPNLMENVLVVPHGADPLPEQFIDFLWQREIAAVIVENNFVHQQESGQTGLGVRVAPGTC